MGQIFILPTTFSMWICMCVPNLVPIGPQTATCIRLEGYTHTHTHTHTLSYIDIDRWIPLQRAALNSVVVAHKPESILLEILNRPYYTLATQSHARYVCDVQRSCYILCKPNQGGAQTAYDRLTLRWHAAAFITLWPNHGTLPLPNDDDDDLLRKWKKADTL